MSSFKEKFDEYKKRKKEEEARLKKEKDEKENKEGGIGFLRGGRSWRYDDDYFDDWDMGSHGRSSEGFTRKTESSFWGSRDYGKSYSSYFGDFGSTETKELMRKAFDMAANFIRAIVPNKKVQIYTHQDTELEKYELNGNAAKIILNTKVFDTKKDSSEKMDIFIGESIHESSHLLYTEEKYIPSADKSFLRFLFNIVESERVESELSKEYPGYVNYLEKYKKYFFEEYLPQQTRLIGAKEEKSTIPLSEPEKLIRSIFNAIRFPSALTKDELDKYRPILEGMKAIMKDFPKNSKETLAKSNQIKDLIEKFYKDFAKEFADSNIDTSMMESMKSKSGEGEGKSSSSKKDLTPEEKKKLFERMLKEMLDQQKNKKDKGEKGEGKGEKGEGKGEKGEGEGEKGEGEGEKGEGESGEGEIGEGNGENGEGKEPKEMSMGKGSSKKESEPTPVPTSSTSSGSARPSHGGSVKEQSEEERKANERVNNLRSEFIQFLLDKFNGDWEKISQLMNNEVESGSMESSMKQVNSSESLRDMKFSRELAIKYGNLIVGEDDKTLFFKMKNSESSYLNVREKVKRYAATLSKVLQFKNVDKKLVNKSTRNGYLDTNKLAEARQGVPTVYERYGHAKSDKIAVCLLIDQSGSMGGSKIERAREAAILFSEALSKNPSIELFVYGHSADNMAGCLVKMDIYKENNSERKFALGGVSAGGNNADGYAIYEAAKRVRKFTTRPCVMFVISDGQPACSRYNSTNGVKHTREMVTKVTREENMQVIQIAIESGIPSKDMFDHFVELKQLDKLPFELSRVLKKVTDKMMKVEIRNY